MRTGGTYPYITNVGISHIYTLNSNAEPVMISARRMRTAFGVKLAYRVYPLGRKEKELVDNIFDKNKSAAYSK